MKQRVFNSVKDAFYKYDGMSGDNEAEWEEMFEYLICVVCPFSGEYEPGEPECGFLFPAFTDRCGDLNHVNVYQKNPARPHMELVREILGQNNGNKQKERWKRDGI